MNSFPGRKRAYLDACILIAAFRGTSEISARAMEILDDPDLDIIVSDYVKLEVLPKPTFQKRSNEVEFMKTVFDAAASNVPSNSDVTRGAVDLAGRYDLTPIDALHVSCAIHSGVDELITGEKSSRPMCKVQEVSVRSLFAD